MDESSDRTGGSKTREALERRLRRLLAVTEDFRGRGLGLDMAENLPREELYDRARARAGMAGYSPAGSSDKT